MLSISNLLEHGPKTRVSASAGQQVCRAVALVRSPRGIFRLGQPDRPSGEQMAERVSMAVLRQGSGNNTPLNEHRNLLLP